VSQVKDAIMQLDEVTRQNAQMVEEASHATGVLDLQAQAVAKALEVFKLPPQAGAKGNANDKAQVSLVHSAPHKARPAQGRGAAVQARHA
jgi:aerotaxis receptor